MPRFGFGFGSNITGTNIAAIGGGAISPFTARFDTTQAGSPSGQLDLPFTPNVGNLVDWGDGTVNSLNTHTYAGTPTDVTVTITGTIDNWRYDNIGDKSKLIEMISLGPDFQVPANSVWRGCNNMVWSVPPNNTPIFTTNNLDSIFLGCALMDGDVSQWDVSGAARMVNMFFAASSFTGIGLENWTVDNCSNFTQMFFGSAFNAPIGNWNMTNATNIGGMFRSTTAFNQDLSGWDVSNCEKFNHVFAGASSFNHDVSTWDMGSAVTIHAMFSSGNFNGDITGWTFGPNINDVSWIFAGNPSFNQDISGWNVAPATNFSNMFGNASSFNQDLSSWLVPNATNMNTMFDNCGMDTTNYSNFLVALSVQSTNNGLTLGAQGRTYNTAGGNARSFMNTVRSWTFVGDSPE